MGGTSLGGKKKKGEREREKKSERVGFDHLTLNAVPSVIQEYCYLWFWHRSCQKVGGEALSSRWFRICGYAS